MRIEFMGHACFLLTSNSGTRILTDPYESGYRDVILHGPVQEPADAVTVSHEHGDHAATSALKGEPQVLKGVGTWKVQDVAIHSVACFHDETGGKERGNNHIFVYQLDGIRVAHLGDLGHALTRDQKEAVGRVDVLLAPTGGHFTLDGRGAWDVFNDLEAAVFIPMHYKNDQVKLPIAELDAFLEVLPSTVSPEKHDAFAVNNLGEIGHEKRVVVLPPRL